MNITTNFKLHTQNYLHRLSSVFKDEQISQIEKLSLDLYSLWQEKKNLFICGNGGSGANAIHIANDLIYGLGAMLEKQRLGMRVEALSSNPAVITCLANDTGYENIFASQIDVKGSQGDILVVLSGSGNSQNVIRAIKKAKEKNILTYSILGFDGGICKKISDEPIHFEISDMQISEDIQMIVFNLCIKWITENINKIEA